MKKRTKFLIVAAAVLVVLAAIGGIIYHELTGVNKILPKDTISIEEADVQNPEKVKLIAHRGLSAIAPENTLASIKEAAVNGFNGVEFDIHLTSDKVWVVSHDPSMKKMTGVNVKISESSLYDLKQLEYNNGANIESYSGIIIPTLEEVLDLLKDYDITPIIEIKTSTEDQINELVTMLKKRGIDEKVWLISFSEKPLKEAKRLNRRIKVAYLTHKINDDVINLCTENGFEAVDFNAKKSSSKKIKKIIDADLIPMAWTVDTKSKLESLSEDGVEYFTTNCIVPAK